MSSLLSTGPPEVNRAPSSLSGERQCAEGRKPANEEFLRVIGSTKEVNQSDVVGSGDEGSGTVWGGDGLAKKELAGGQGRLAEP